MKARTLIENGRHPSTKGVYANLSKWPRVDYYIKCPACGAVHGNFDRLDRALDQKLCDACNLTATNGLKDEIEKVVHDPEHEPKEMTKLMGEALVESEDSDDGPPDIKGDIDRLLFGNWVNVAIRDFADKEGYSIDEIDINDAVGDYDPDDLDSTTYFAVIAGHREWFIFKNTDVAENVALKQVRNDLNNEPELFAKDWLRNFVDEDRLRQAIGDPYEDWENDVRDLSYDDLLDKMVDEGYVTDGDEEFFDSEGDKLEENRERTAALNAHMETYIEREKPVVDPWEQLEDAYGAEEAVKWAVENAGIDVEKAAEDAIRTDGWEHFVACYDGNSNELDNGAVYCRTD